MVPTEVVTNQDQIPEGFSIFWMTDTQYLSEKNPALYRMAANWIVKNWLTYNGKLVIHTGDFVQTGSDYVEWQNADEAMHTLLKNGIPYTWCAGNHDDYMLSDPTSGWIGREVAQSLDPAIVSQHVNALGYANWASDYHDGMNTAISFSASGLDLLVINVEWNAQPDVLVWVQGLLDDPQYAGYHVIVAPHAYINSTGSLNDPSWGAVLATFNDSLTTLMNQYSSKVFLTLNGHFPTDCGYNTPNMINNRNQLMFDRQDSTDDEGEPTGRGADDVSKDSDNVGGSTVTILTFSPASNEINVRTFDIYKALWRIGPTEQYSINMFPVATLVTPVAHHDGAVGSSSLVEPVMPPRSSKT